MNIRASATTKWGDFARIEEVIVPKLVKGVGEGTEIVFQESQDRVHVDTGELKASGRQSVEWVSKKVNGTVEYTAEHAAYNEFGTGARGAASPGAGPYSYNEEWPGMAAIPFLRPALDVSRDRIVDAIKHSLSE